LIANETEALQLSGSENISEAVEALQKKYKIKNVIVTLGSDGFALKTDEELTKHPVAEKVKVVDTTALEILSSALFRTRSLRRKSQRSNMQNSLLLLLLARQREKELKNRILVVLNLHNFYRAKMTLFCFFD